MVSLKINVLLLLLLCFSSVYAHHGSTHEHDYFDTYRHPQMKEFLGIVDVNHTNKVPALIREGRTRYAIEECKYALTKFPNHPKALMLISAVARLNKTLSLPIPYFERALKLYPQHGLTHAQYGSYLVSIGRVGAGIAKLKEAIDVDPKLAAAHAWLAIAYSKNGDLELARHAAEQARELGYKGKIAGAE